VRSIGNLLARSLPDTIDLEPIAFDAAYVGRAIRENTEKML